MDQTVVIEKQDVTSEHPLQYKFTTYKTVKDINGVDVKIEDKVDIKNTLDLAQEKDRIEKQILNLQSQIDEIDSKLLEIGKL